MTSIDLEKIWLWISDESRAHEKIEDKTISPEDGVAYVERWLTAVSSEQLFRVSRAMAERGEQELAEELHRVRRTVERTRVLAGHANSQIAKLYDRRGEKVSLAWRARCRALGAGHGLWISRP